MKSVINYKGFSLIICFSKLCKSLIGTIYSKRFKHSIYYTKTHYGYLEESLLAKMKDEVDKLIKNEREYLERQIEQTKQMLIFLNSQSSILNEEENE